MQFTLLETRTNYSLENTSRNITHQNLSNPHVDDVNDGSYNKSPGLQCFSTYKFSLFHLFHNFTGDPMNSYAFSRHVNASHVFQPTAQGQID